MSIAPVLLTVNATIFSIPVASSIFSGRFWNISPANFSFDITVPPPPPPVLGGAGHVPQSVGQVEHVSPLLHVLSPQYNPVVVVLKTSYAPAFSVPE